MDKTVLFEHTLWGHTLRGRAYIEAGEPRTNTESGWPTNAIVEVVYLNGGLLDCLEVLNPALIHLLEAAIAKDYDENN